MTWARAGLLYLAFASLLVGVWAQFWPQSFYADFPGFGRAWVSVDGPYNEHLIRDVGGLNLGLGLAALLALRSLDARVIGAVSVVALAFGVPHFVYHLEHLAALPTLADQVGNVFTLGLNVIVPALLFASSLVAPGPRGESR